ncbi:fibronectin type III domain-containing protein [Flavobacterium chuncheonense]|uniref:Fibronectin type III domain-containing protein n=1 Tax=Flavobacterium chuncheonense TaxID=2026653 RepID=A0ABW5YKJ9_9FLAO
MKKITLFLFFLFSCLGFAQVPIGNGTNELQSLPFDPFFGYTYSQSIYYASEINANGNITSLQWYFSGAAGSTIPDNQNITVYLGHTTKTSFASNTDWEPLAGLTAVYTGGIPVNGPGWVTITFTTPFAYNGTDNLVIAVDENMSSYDASSDDFYNTAVSSPRSIFFRSDSINPDPATPPTTGTLLSTVSFVPNVILQGIAPPCVAPNNLVAQTVLSNSVALTWNDPSGTQSDYEYVIQPVGTGIPTANGTAVSSSTTVTDNTVQPNTNYEVYVRANCGTDGYSTWHGPITFLTPCVTSNAPWTYDVETAATTTNSSISDCWTSNPTGTTASFRWDVDGNGSTPTTTTGPSGAHSGVNYFYTESSTGVQGAVAELYTPMVNISALTVPALQFYYHMYGNTMGELHVDVYNGTAWVNDVDVIIGQQQAAETDPWTLKIVNLAAYTGTIQVRFRGIRGSGGYSDMALDDISIEEAPSCLPPSNIVVSNIAAQSVQLGWDDMSNVSQFDFEYVIQAQGTGIPTANGILVSDYSVTDNTLTSNTFYEVYLRADCGTEYSSWVGPVSFKTLCDPFTVPYTENFDAYPSGSSTNLVTPDCWFNVDTGVGYGYVSSTYSNSAPRSYYMYNGNDTTGDYMLVSPQTTALSSGLNRTHFFARGGSSGYLLEVGTLTDPSNPSSFSLITSITLTNTQTEYTVYIPTGTNLHLAFRHGLGGTYRSVYIDDIVVEAIPSCVEPADFEFSNLSNTSVSLTWSDPSGVQSNYEYVIQAPGTGEPTSSGLPATGTSVTDNTLTANTTYEAYVRGNCGAGDYSVWVGPITFTTLCNAFTVPYSENFDAYSTGSTANNNTPDCWSYLEPAGGLGYGYISSTTPNSGNRNFYLYNSGDSTGDYMLVSPQTTDLSNGLNRARFFARTSSASSGFTIEVGTMSDVTDPSTFTLLSTIALTNVYTQYVVNIPAGTDTFVAFRHGLGGTYRSLYLDDITVEAIPSTPPTCVTNLVATPDPVCGNYATVITWDPASGADGYKVTMGTTPGGNDVLNAVDLGYTTTYPHIGAYNSTLYYTIVAYNGFGDATGCTEGSFTTAVNGCYCPSVPTSNDVNGITGGVIGTASFTNPDVTYTDNTTLGTPQVFEKGTLANVSLTFDTGAYTYDVNIWIDFNDDFNFDSSELVQTGIASSSSSPNTLDASFTVPTTGIIGNHRMRIGTADFGQATPNPCYSGSFGVTLDFTVNVIENLSTSTFVNNTFKAYPNPVKDIFKIEYDTEISNVTVVNLLGQVVINNLVNATATEINMSHLNAGTYMVNVTIGDAIKTIKVIKD